MIPPATSVSALAHSHLSRGFCLRIRRAPSGINVRPAEAGNHFMESMFERVSWLMIEIVALALVNVGSVVLYCNSRDQNTSSSVLG